MSLFVVKVPPLFPSRKRTKCYNKKRYILNLLSMKVLGAIAVILTVVGGINWGLVGIGGFAETNLNLVNLIFGSWPTVEWIVYILVGISALLVGWAHMTKKCEMKQ